LVVEEEASDSLTLFQEANSNISRLKTEIKAIMDMVLLEVDSTTTTTTTITTAANAALLPPPPHDDDDDGGKH